MGSFIMPSDQSQVSQSISNFLVYPEVKKYRFVSLHGLTMVSGQNTQYVTV